jgi:plasmid stability protein
MARGDFPSSKQDQFVLRFPDGMRDRIKAVADRNGRSMNAEIIARLEQSIGFEEVYGTLEEVMLGVWKDIEELQRKVSDHDEVINPGRYRRD